jgi:hypothetical protein
MAWPRAGEGRLLTRGIHDCCDGAYKMLGPLLGDAYALHALQAARATRLASLTPAGRLANLRDADAHMPMIVAQPLAQQRAARQLPRQLTCTGHQRSRPSAGRTAPGRCLEAPASSSATTDTLRSGALGKQLMPVTELSIDSGCGHKRVPRV